MAKISLLSLLKEAEESSAWWVDYVIEHDYRYIDIPKDLLESIDNSFPGAYEGDTDDVEFATAEIGKFLDEQNKTAGIDKYGDTDAEQDATYYTILDWTDFENPDESQWNKYSTNLIVFPDEFQELENVSGQDIQNIINAGESNMNESNNTYKSKWGKFLQESKDTIEPVKEDIEDSRALEDVFKDALENLAYDLVDDVDLQGSPDRARDGYAPFHEGAYSFIGQYPGFESYEDHNIRLQGSYHDADGYHAINDKPTVILDVVIDGYVIAEVIFNVESMEDLESQIESQVDKLESEWNASNWQPTEKEYDFNDEDEDLDESVNEVKEDEIDTIYIEGIYKDGSEFYEDQETTDIEFVKSNYREITKDLKSSEMFIRMNNGDEVSYTEYKKQVNKSVNEDKPHISREESDKLKSGDKITYYGPKGKTADTVDSTKGGYVKLKSGGTVPYQSIVKEEIKENKLSLVNILKETTMNNYESKFKQFLTEGEVAKEEVSESLPLKEDYNGWTNYATWRVALEVFDGMDEEQVRGFADHESLEDYVEELLTMNGEEGLAVEYARAFLNDVNYREILKHMRDDHDISDEDEE